MLTSRIDEGGKSIVIVHATPLFRLGVESILTEANCFSEYRISSASTLDEVEAYFANAVAGDVFVLDVTAWLSLTNPARFEMLQEFRRRGLLFAVIATHEQMKITRLSTHGLSGLVSANAEPKEITHMMKNLICRRGSLEIDQQASKNHASINKALRAFQLTDRQLKILKLMAEGLTNRRIASELEIHEGTVKWHIIKIFRKLNCTHRAQAISTLMRAG